MSHLPFAHLISLEPLGLLYGSLGRLLSPEALTGRASEHFPPDSPAFSGLLASQLSRNEVWDLHTAGPFWLHPEAGLMLPAPLTLLQEIKDGKRVSQRRLAWCEGNGDLIPSGWRPADQQEPPRKAPTGGWIGLNDWPKVVSDGEKHVMEEIDIHDDPWQAVPHLHPRLADDQRISAGDGALFLEYGIALEPGVALAYLSSHEVPEGVYRFGGEGHLVQLRCLPVPTELTHLLSQPLIGSFALITPGVWGGPKLSLREPIVTSRPNGQLPWHQGGQAPGILTDKPRPWRHRLGVGDGTAGPDGKVKRRRLARGRWAVPSGSCYWLLMVPAEAESSEIPGAMTPWAEWPEEWFPREGFSFKQLGTALALPLHPPP
jgi:CRISPR-associated protein Cmr3